jgi:ATP adenylyltransferase
MEFIRRPKDEQAGCVLCGYAAAERDRSSRLLARQANAYVVLNKYPYTGGHVMIVPTRHVNDLAALTADEYDALFRLVRAALASLRAATGCPGVNLGVNLGSAAGAGIEEHVHVHLVPRWNGDNNFMPVIGDVRIMHEYLEATWDHLAPHFAPLHEEPGA